MATIDRRNGKWCARWRAYPGGPQQRKTFTRKIDAEQFLIKVQHDLLTGDYVPPAKAKTTLAQYTEEWLERMRPTWRPSTAATVEASLRGHILPTLGSRPLLSIKRADIEAWARSLSLASSTVATVRQHLGQVLAAAVEDGLLARNPATRARMPRVETNRPEPVPAGTIAAITDALPDWCRVIVPLGVGAGLRQGEACGLSVDRTNLLRRTLRVDRQLLTHVSAAPEFGPPKTETSCRTIPLAGFVVDAIAAHIAQHGTGTDELIVHQPNRDAVGRNRFGRIWRAATLDAGAVGIRYHDLRHTFASTLLSEGVSIKAVSEWLGHASAMVTLGTYSHVMPDDDDRARGVLDRALGPAVESQLSPSVSA